MSTESATQSSANAIAEATSIACVAIDAERAPALAKVLALGVDELCGMVLSGMTYVEIAKRLGISNPALHGAINRFGWRDTLTRALPESAEAWLDRGLEAIENADDSSNSAVNKARYIAMECARRAAVRNPRYSDKQQVELSGPNGGPIQQAVVHVFVPANNRDTVVNTVDDEG